MKKIKVMIGLSGGVDSAVAAALLIEQGYEVIAGFMRNWDAVANGDFLGNPTLNDPCCPQEADYADAKQVADQLGIPLYRIDFIEEYWNEVFTYFLAEYQKGRTPNPDIFCNKYIKFDAFLNFAKEHGCDYMATGHYAKRVEVDGEVWLLKAKDRNKDQTYFLSQLSASQIASCLFPLGDLCKDEVRAIAQKYHFAIAHKKDSTGVCFIGERHFKAFLQNYLPAKAGEIRDKKTGKVLGKHDGVLYYTLGQRKGLGIGGISGTDNHAWFVCEKDVPHNILYVTNGPQEDELLSVRASVRQLNWLGQSLPQGEAVQCKFRYRQADQGIHITANTADEAWLEFDVPYAAITPGQAAVFYQGDRLIGGGIIEEVVPFKKAS